MDNTWYYTLSTISQTLAAILGLGAVFVVLRLQGLNKNIADYRAMALNILRSKKENIRDYKMPSDEIVDILKELRNFKENYRDDNLRGNAGVLQAMNIWAQTYSDHGYRNDMDFMNDVVDRLNFFTSQRDDVLKMIKWPGIFMFISIALAIISLGFSDCLSYRLILWFIVFFSAFSFWSIIRASWKILDAIKRLE